MLSVILVVLGVPSVIVVVWGNSFSDFGGLVENALVV